MPKFREIVLFAAVSGESSFPMVRLRLDRLDIKTMLDRQRAFRIIELQWPTAAAIEFVDAGIDCGRLDWDYDNVGAVVENWLIAPADKIEPGDYEWHDADVGQIEWQNMLVTEAGIRFEIMEKHNDHPCDTPTLTWKQIEGLNTGDLSEFHAI